MNTLNWQREPFNGGCHYYCEQINRSITGWYDSPAFEAECTCWEGQRDEFFPTREEAIASVLPK